MIDQILLKQKIKAFTIHFCFSLFILGGTLALAAAWFYPGVLWVGDGGLEAIKIALLVDIVLGPVLVFCIYNPSKPKLKMDYSIVLTLQIMVWAYGLFVMFDQRPVALIFSDMMHSTTVHQIIETKKESEDKNANPNLYGGRIPVYVYSMPIESKEIQARALEAMNAGRPFFVDRSYWVSQKNENVYRSNIERGSERINRNSLKTQEAKTVYDRIKLKNKDDVPVILQMRYKNALCGLDVENARLRNCEITDLGRLLEY